MQSRKDIPEDYKHIYIDSIINGNKDTSYTEQDVLDTMFRDKNITTYEEAFADILRIKHTT